MSLVGLLQRSPGDCLLRHLKGEVAAIWSTTHWPRTARMETLAFPVCFGQLVAPGSGGCLVPPLVLSFSEEESSLPY